MDFLSTRNVVNILSNKLCTGYPAIPLGKKENKYFVVKNTRNEERRNKDVKRKFYDDCGAWLKVSYYKSYYICKS